MMDYYSLLNDYDRQWMNACIHETINSYGDHIVAFIPLPVARQKNYNKMMREFIGPIYYYKKIIRAERVELSNGFYDGIPPDDIDYGRRDDGQLMYAIPDDIPIFDDAMKIHGFEDWLPEMFMVFQIDGTKDRYYVRTVKKRIGQSLLLLYKYDGTTWNGIDMNDIMVVEDEDSADFDTSAPLFVKTDDTDDADSQMKAILAEKTENIDGMSIYAKAVEVKNTDDIDAVRVRYND